MDKSFCEQIDRDALVEAFVAGQLYGKLLENFKKHISECDKHAKEVALEKALKEGVSEYARSEIKSKIRQKIKKRDDSRIFILRYAAIIFLIVFTPLLLYYQLEFKDLDREIKPDAMSEPESHKLIDVGIAPELPKSADEKTEQPVLTAGRGKKEEKKSDGQGPVTAQKEKPAKSSIPIESEKVDESPVESILSEVIVAQSDIEKTKKMDDSINKDSEGLVNARAKTVTQPSMALTASGESYSADLEDLKISYASTMQVVDKVTFSKISIQIQQYENQITECIKTNAEKNKIYIKMEFLILTSGNTSEVKITESLISLKSFEDCLFEKIKTWKFEQIDQELHILRIIKN